jgi:hypothetical protein
MSHETYSVDRGAGRRTVRERLRAGCDGEKRLRDPRQKLQVRWQRTRSSRVGAADRGRSPRRPPENRCRQSDHAVHRRARLEARRGGDIVASRVTLARAPRWCAFTAQTILPHARHSSRFTTPHASASDTTPPPRPRPRFALALSEPVTRFFRGTFAPNPETFRVSGRGSAQNSAREIGDFASDFASLQFSKRPSENTKRREVAAHECFRLAGPTGPEPATSGVTGRRSNLPGTERFAGRR